MKSEIDTSAFASAIQPIVADTLIVTSTEGLTAGDIRIDAADGTISGYRAMPEGRGSLPIVLVVQEIFGVHEHIKDVARRFAKLGYLAVAPELFERQGDVKNLDSLEAIRAVVAQVPDAQVMSDLDASLAWAEQHGGDPQRVAVTGFCWGGRAVWLYAAHQPKLKAAVAWYGRLAGDPTPFHPRPPLDVMAELKAPVLGLYGGSDPGIPLATVERAQAALATAASPSKFHIYPDAGHAFYADYRPNYREPAAHDGWQRLRAWFAEHGV